MTALSIAGIALGNVLMPAWVKLHGGSHTVTLVALNSSLISASGAIGPLSALMGGGESSWQQVLLVWAWVALAQVLVWIIVICRTGYDFPDNQQRAASGSIWRSRTAVLLMLYFGVQSMNGYVQMGYLPHMLIDAGVTRSTASIAIALVGAMGILGGIFLPRVLEYAESMTPWVLGIGLFGVTGYLLVAFVPAQAPLLWAVIMGIGGWAFPLALALIVARSREAEVTARLSGFVQPIGYIIAAVGPFIVGALYTPETPNWTVILVGLAVTSAIQALMGVGASQRRFVDDELAVAH